MKPLFCCQFQVEVIELDDMRVVEGANCKLNNATKLLVLGGGMLQQLKAFFYISKKFFMLSALHREKQSQWHFPQTCSKYFRTKFVYVYDINYLIKYRCSQ